MQMRNVLRCASFAALAMVANFASAQVTRQAQPVVQPAGQPVGQPVAGSAAQRGQGSNWQSNDQTVAACLAIANQEEIALAKFAQEKTDNKDVKEFTDMLIKDHQDFLKKLAKFSPEANRDSLTAGNSGQSDRASNIQQAGGTQNQANGNQPAQNQQGRGVQQTGAAQPAAGHQGGMDIVQLHREIAAQCLADSKKDLSEKDKDEFDACFVGHQITMHGAMASKLAVLQRHASGELADVIKEGRETTLEHKEHAEKLVKQLAEIKKDSGSKKDSKSSKSNRD